MKKITRKRFTQSKGNKSFFGSVARFGAAIPLCLLMLGGLSFVGVDHVKAATGTIGGDAAGTVDGVPALGTLVLDSTDTGLIPVGVGAGGNASGTAQGGQGGSTELTGTPTSTADIVFSGNNGGNGVNGGAGTPQTGFNGGNAGNYDWTRTTSLTVGSITNSASVGGNGGDSGTFATSFGGTGGTSSGLNIDFGANRLNLTGSNGGMALGLEAGTGGIGGATVVGALNSAGVGGSGGDVSFTAGIVNVSRNDNIMAAVAFLAGDGGDAGVTDIPTAVANAGFTSGDGGAGGSMTVNMAGINFVSSAGGTNNLIFAGGDAGDGAAGSAAIAAALTAGDGHNGGAGGAGGILDAKVTGNINVKANMGIFGGDGGAGNAGNDGNAASATASATGGAGGAGGVGGSATLVSGSINVAESFAVSGGLGDDGGNGGDATDVGTSAAFNGDGGAGGAGGAGGNVTLNNLGMIKVGDGFIIGSSSAVAAGNGGAAGGLFADGGAGGDAGAVGGTTITSGSIFAGSMYIDAIGGTGGVGGASALDSTVDPDQGVGGVGGAGAAGGAVDVTAQNIVVAGSVEILAHGGTGGDGGAATSFGDTSGAGGVGGAGGNVDIYANELWIGGNLYMGNADGANGAAGANSDGTYGLGGAGGAAGNINLHAMVTAAEISGTVGQTYNIDGIGLDAGQQQVSFSRDFAYDTATSTPSLVAGNVVGTATAVYNIGTMRVDASDNSLFLGDYISNGDSFGVNNTVYRTLRADNLSKLNVANFDFILPSEVRDGDILLRAENAPAPTDTTLDDLKITGATGISIETPARIRNMHRDLGSITLIDGEVTGANNVAGRRINSGIYRFVLEEGSLVARLDGIPGFNAYSEAQAARLAFVADALNYTITSGIMELSKATEGDEVGVRFFASGYGSKNRYNTGYQSHADIEGAGFLAGAGFGTDTVDGQRLLVGAFMEGGWGSYNTRSSSHGVSFDADGNTNYLGAGIMGKYTFPFGLYFDLSGRLGQAKLDFRSDDLGTNGYEDSFDSTHATYFGGHIGGGYEWAIDEQQMLDFNTRLLWTHLNSDQVNSNYGDRIDFNSADSVRWRTGARYNYAFDLGTGGTLKPFVGVAYEHEFNGDASTHVDGRRTERKASLSGGTAIGELGASWQATDNFSMEVAGQGNVFTRQGGGGQLSLKWEF